MKHLLSLPWARAPRALALLALAWIGNQQTILGQGTAFTYQGRLTDGGNAYTGTAEFQATLWSVPSGGTAVATNSPASVVADVTNGLFVLPLNFGNNFPGADRWLEIGVRTNGGGAFTNLTPRQKITPTPYAITASNLSGTLPTAQLSGTLASAQLGGTYSGAVTLNNAGNSFTGNGSGLTGLNANNLSSGTVPTAALGNAWKTTGNSGTSEGTHFLGTTDDQPLEFKVNGLRALRLEDNSNSINVGAPNLIGGSPANFVSGTVQGSIIAGGGTTDRGGVVYGHIVRASYATIGGGMGHRIEPDSEWSTVAGGSENQIDNESECATIGGGLHNIVGADANNSTIPGGQDNEIGAGAINAFAAGNRAKANHSGAFVWADSTAADFASTANNQFSIRAANGVRISNPGENRTLLTFETERPWAFRQLFTGAGTALELGIVDPNNRKDFIIRGNAVGINVTAPTHVLHVNGVARSTQSTWATSSDRRAKRDIATLEGSLERIARLRPVSFEYTPEYAAGRKGYEGRFTGFIAQEVEPVFPEMVETVQEKIGDREIQDFRVLNAGGLTPHLVAAIQGLNQKLTEELKRRDAENAELKRSVDELKTLADALARKLDGGGQ